jgi:hypothetical protein
MTANFKGNAFVDYHCKQGIRTGEFNGIFTQPSNECTVIDREIWSKILSR